MRMSQTHLIGVDVMNTPVDREGDLLSGPGPLYHRGYGAIWRGAVLAWAD
jgi:hypothetical protein